MKAHNTDPENLIIYADASFLTEDTPYYEYLSKIDKERRSYIERFKYRKDQSLSLLGGYLLNLAIKEMGIQECFTKDEYGKPVLKHSSHIYLSLSHSFPYVAAMVSTHPCGVDIENRNRKIDKIAKVFFTDREWDYHRKGHDLMDIWCRRECIQKLDKPRDIRMIDSFSIPDNYFYLSPSIPGFSFEILMHKGDYEIKKYRKETNHD